MVSGIIAFALQRKSQLNMLSALRGGARRCHPRTNAAQRSVCTMAAPSSGHRGFRQRSRIVVGYPDGFFTMLAAVLLDIANPSRHGLLHRAQELSSGIQMDFPQCGQRYSSTSPSRRATAFCNAANRVDLAHWETVMPPPRWVAVSFMDVNSRPVK